MSNQSKTLEDLKQILDSERESCVKGKSSYLVADPDLRLQMDRKFSDDPLYQFVGLDGFGSTWAYHDFRDEVIKYQVANKISALEWEEVWLDDEIKIHQPDVAMEFDPLDSDMETMRAYRDSVVEKWVEYIKKYQSELFVWHTGDRDDDWFDIDTDSILALAQQCDWATAKNWTEGDYKEIILEIGWGNPVFAGYGNHPESDSFWFYSAPRDCWVDNAWFDPWTHVHACPVGRSVIERLNHSA